MAKSSFFSGSGVSTTYIRDLESITAETAALKDAAAASALGSTASANDVTEAANIAAASASSAQLSEAAAVNSQSDAAASASQALSSQTAAASSEFVANANATAAADSEANASTSANAASTSEVASASSASAALASQSSAASSESASAVSAAASLASQTAASASEVASAASQASAASSEVASAASQAASAVSEANASTSAATATTKASEAATSATNSATSAADSETAKTAAEAAKDAALAALDSFDDRYLGAKASDPTLDNDGNSLIAGALYYDTTDDVMKVYEGSVWVAAYASLSGALLVANNLSDLESASAARTNLGLGTAATTPSTDYATAAQGALANSAVQPNDSPSFGSVTVSGTVDGRDVAADGTKLDGIEVGADVTDAANVEPLVDTHLNVIAATTGQVLSWDGADYDWVEAGGSAGGSAGDTVGTITSGDVDLSTGTVFADVPSANVTYTFSNPPAAGTGYSFTLRILGGEDATTYDIANAVYDDVIFNTYAQERSSQGFVFKPDGKKMYVIGLVANTVFQYSLSSPFDLSTASYDGVSFVVSGQDTSCRSLAFSGDGTKMYVVGSGSDAVYQYTLSTGFDLSTATYDNVSLSVSAQATGPQTVTISPDGTKMHIVGPDSDSVHQYTLSTGFDLSTAAYDTSFSVAAQESTAYGLGFSADGTSMFIVGRDDGDRIRQYTLTTAFDISTASYANIAFYMYPPVIRGVAVQFSANGKKMFVLDLFGNNIYQFTVSVSNIVYTFDYPASVDWFGNEAPVDPTPGVTDILEFFTDDGGATYYGSLIYSTDSSKALSNLGLSATATEINVLDGITASTAELNYVDGVTSNIQTQIDNIPAPPELTQVQVEDDTSTVFGQVSGQRLGQAILANASGRVELARTTVSTSVASVEFTAFDASKYESYYFEFTGIVQSVALQYMLAELSTDGGSTWVTGSNYGGSYMGTNNSTNQSDGFSGAIITGDSVEVDGNIHLTRAGDAGRKTRMIYTVVKLVGSNTPFVALGGIMRKVNAVDNALRFRPESGNFDAGTFVMYGVE